MHRSGLTLAVLSCLMVFIAPGNLLAQTPDSTSVVLADVPIAYQNSGAIFVYEPGTGSRRVAPSVAGSQEAPDWSPDGNSVAFHIDFQEIAYADVASGDVTPVVTCGAPCAFVFDPAWAPDGTSIAFVRIIGTGQSTGAAQIVVVDIKTQTEKVIYEDSAGDIWLYGPRWAPDGQHLVVEWDQFASNLLSEDRVKGTGLGIVDLELAELNRLAETEGGSSPDWRPNGDLIVFVKDGNLATIRPDGSRLGMLTTFDPTVESAIQPTFAPDGFSIVFVWVHGVIGQGETPNVGILALDGGDPYQLADSDWFTHPRLRPSTTSADDGP